MMTVAVLAISRWPLVAEGRASAFFAVATSPSPPCHVARLVRADAVQARVFTASVLLSCPEQKGHGASVCVTYRDSALLGEDRTAPEGLTHFAGSWVLCKDIDTVPTLHLLATSKSL